MRAARPLIRVRAVRCRRCVRQAVATDKRGPVCERHRWAARAALVPGWIVEPFRWLWAKHIGVHHRG